MTFLNLQKSTFYHSFISLYSFMYGLTLVMAAAQWYKGNLWSLYFSVGTEHMPSFPVVSTHWVIIMCQPSSVNSVVNTVRHDLNQVWGQRWCWMASWYCNYNSLFSVYQPADVQRNTWCSGFVCKSAYSIRVPTVVKATGYKSLLYAFIFIHTYVLKYDSLVKS